MVCPPGSNRARQKSLEVFAGRGTSVRLLDLQNLLELLHHSFTTDSFSEKFKDKMAGAVRQPLDILLLSEYIEKYIPSIKIPISVKQVFPNRPGQDQHVLMEAVRLRAVQPNLSDHRKGLQEIRSPKEAPWAAALENSPSS